MTMRPLTVVIPTYNRAPILKKALEAYLTQGTPDAIHELIVVDDGSTDETKEVVEEIGRRASFPVRYFRQENKGPAAARNVGIRETRSEILLFTDDDIIPGRTLVAEHLEWHGKFPQKEGAVLGHVTWVEVQPTPFMRWYGEQGALFSYGKFHRGQQLTYLDFYTCNLSLNTEFLRTCGRFDEEFKSAAYEDIELGYRLSKTGLKLVYNPDAIAYHHQHFSFTDACRRSRRNGPALEVFKQKEAGRRYCGPPSLKQRFIRQTAKLVGPVLAPFRNVMDSSVPLPAIIYKIMFKMFTY